MERKQVEEIISSRKSVRSFSNDKVEQEDINTIVNCGLKAPCARGIHAGHIYSFIKGEDKYTRLVKYASDETGRDPFYGGNVILVVAMDPSSLYPDLDGAAIIENMLLAASMLGLGACWINSPRKFLNEHPNYKTELGIDTNNKVIASIVVSHKA